MTLIVAALMLPAHLSAAGQYHEAVDDRSSLQHESSLAELPGSTIQRLEVFERKCFDEVNEQRRANGVAPLAAFDKLVAVARRYSRRMAEGNFFSHTDPQGLTLRFRLIEAGIKSSVQAENLSKATGYIDPVPGVVEGWMKSPGHRANLLDPTFTHSAVGAWIAGDDLVFFTQIYLKP
ncbi:MAG TPA: CAP domain-containing protein [Blastocatellia bacterium]|nr:CAP domain-containing protein [Blastocatellia bacterium]